MFKYLLTAKKVEIQLITMLIVNIERESIAINSISLKEIRPSTSSLVRYISPNSSPIAIREPINPFSELLNKKGFRIMRQGAKPRLTKDALAAT